MNALLRAAVRAAVGLPSVAEQMELALESQKRQAAAGGGLSGLWGMYQQGANASAKQLAAENSGAAAAAPAKAWPAATSSPLSSSALSRAARKRR